MCNPQQLDSDLKTNGSVSDEPINSSYTQQLPLTNLRQLFLKKKWLKKKKKWISLLEHTEGKHLPSGAICSQSLALLQNVYLQNASPVLDGAFIWQSWVLSDQRELNLL